MKILYICEGCGKQYDRIVKAQECESKDPGEQLVEPGDIVTARYGFGWFDGDRRWVVNPDVKLRHRDGKEVCPNGNGNCFSKCCTYGFYYVVTAVDTHNHRTRYHLRTRAMGGKTGYRGGYTYTDDHITPKKVGSPSDFLVRSGRGLVGEKCKGLL